MMLTVEEANELMYQYNIDRVTNSELFRYTMRRIDEDVRIACYDGLSHAIIGMPTLVGCPMEDSTLNVFIDILTDLGYRVQIVPTNLDKMREITLHWGE